MALLEEVFSQNKTLIEVLDQNGVTDISSIREDIHRVETNQVQQKDQLDSLGRTVDSYQKSNEAQFVDFNTRINNLSKVVDDMTLDFVSIIEFNAYRNATAGDINNIQISLGQMSTAVTSLDNSVSRLNTITTSQQQQIDMNVHDLKEINSNINELETEIAQKCFVYRDTQYYLMSTDSANLKVQPVILSGPFGREVGTNFIEFVSKYSLTPPYVYGGVEYRYISFIQTGSLNSGVTTNLRLVPTGYQTVYLWSSTNQVRKSPILIVKT